MILMGLNLILNSMKKFSLFTLLVLISILASAQISFTGNWSLNQSKSKLNAEFSMAPTKLIIEQNSNELKVERHSNFQGNEVKSIDKFTLDGKECVNAGWGDSQKKSTCKWDADKKKLTIVTKIPMFDDGEMTLNEVYSLNGKELVVESTAVSSFGELKETMVYN
jgi:hypothetical protein